jgi:hypothetical protein
MITKDKLADAVRAIDNLADVGVGFDEALRKRGFDPTAVTYVAQQRALRMVLVAQGRTPELEPMTARGIAFSARERQMIAQFATAWIDGLLAGSVVSKTATP